ncbi:hypothetical protein [Pedobacter xixiisoli]|uniref:Lanthionine synthetase C-like protein n=1 Tax=Pedobacter xixiisoli TaxID=1476464 RepID=A0A285ZS05_9SPHI|nr:hypothetical protein [Pedobacter xixiisoli]SOD12431.1 hypothetical protein SAMN06297358_0665 [Pedobacter xixiisoli]
MNINENTVKERLERINRFLLLNVDFIPSLGLIEGKIGVCLYLMEYAAFFEDEKVFKLSCDLFDEIIENLNINQGNDFKRGLCGITFAIEELVSKGIIDLGDENILEEVYSKILSDAETIQSSDMMNGLGCVIYCQLKRLANSNDANKNDIEAILYKYFSRFDIFEIDRIDLPLTLDMLTLAYELLDSKQVIEEKLLETAKRLSSGVDLQDYKNYNPIFLASLFNTSFEKTALKIFYEMANNMLAEHEETFNHFINKESSVSSHTNADILLSYINMRNLPIQSITEKINFWERKTFEEIPSSIAGFNIDQEVSNFRMFASYARQGRKLIQYLNNHVLTNHY